MKILMIMVASLALLASPAIAKHGGSGGGGHHSKSESDGAKADKNGGGKEAKDKSGDKDKDSAKEANPLSDFLSAVTKKPN